MLIAPESTEAAVRRASVRRYTAETLPVVCGNAYGEHRMVALWDPDTGCWRCLTCGQSYYPVERRHRRERWPDGRCARPWQGRLAI